MLTADAVGGVWQYSIELATALQPFGYDVTLAVLGPPLQSSQRESAAGVKNLRITETGLPLEWLADEPESIAAAEERLAAMAGDLHADIVQLHTPALANTALYPCPVVATLHSCVATWWSAVRGGPAPDDFVWRTVLVKKGLECADIAVAPSAAFAAVAQRHYGVAPMAVHNGRSLPLVPAAMQDFVFTAGRLWDEGKNVRVLDEAAARICVPFKAAGPRRSPQGDMISLQALHPLGSLDDAALARQLAARPVFASAALYEPFGLAVLEAAIAGCALILSDIPTFRELWDDVASFVDPRDPLAYARVIQDMVEDLPRRLEAGRRAQQRARRYTPAVMAGRMASLYDKVQRRVAA
ncbi:glycosyltransferase family 4 protein [Sphingobium sp.]|uniref:glycosyltransferase family 4 protein n=1 Tax=Sphingobium sp. TaxID=1912891 RepID=UPI002BBF71C2|nr:glycosyltransferase family 4 protein [Sphingobium sp.]HUD95303.1 glycosyltransferase family 4 protein [Sphingobium sp.]